MKLGWPMPKLTKTSKATQGGQEELCKWDSAYRSGIYSDLAWWELTQCTDVIARSLSPVFKNYYSDGREKANCMSVLIKGKDWI